MRRLPTGDFCKVCGQPAMTYANTYTGTAIVGYTPPMEPFCDEHDPNKGFTLTIGSERLATAERERDEARAQLSEATARVVVLEAALTLATDIVEANGYKGRTMDLRAVLASPNPLAAAVGHVVTAGIGVIDSTDDLDENILELQVRVNALRALAPWWPTAPPPPGA